MNLTLFSWYDNDQISWHENLQAINVNKYENSFILIYHNASKKNIIISWDNTGNFLEKIELYNSFGHK